MLIIIAIIIIIIIIAIIAVIVVIIIVLLLLTITIAIAILKAVPAQGLLTFLVGQFCGALWPQMFCFCVFDFVVVLLWAYVCDASWRCCHLWQAERVGSEAAREEGTGRFAGSFSA